MCVVSYITLYVIGYALENVWQSRARQDASRGDARHSKQAPDTACAQVSSLLLSLLLLLLL